MTYKLFLNNFDFSNNVIKLILKAKNTTKTPLLATIFNQFNFLTFDEFFTQFNNLTKLFNNDILFPVFLYIPDNLTNYNSFYFFIKSPNTNFLIKKCLIYENYSTTINFIKINLINIFKVSIIKSFFLQNNIFTINLMNIKNLFFSLKGFLKSLQNININNINLNYKVFKIIIFL